MEIVDFTTVDDMVSVIDGYIKNRKQDYMNIDIIAHYEYITHLVESFIREGYTITNINLTDQACSGYCKEYLLAICNEEISVGPLCRDKDADFCYAETWSDIAFIHRNCESALLPSVKTKTKYDFSIQEYDDENDCYHFSAAVTNNSKMCAISFSSSNQNDVDEIKQLFHKLAYKH